MADQRFMEIFGRFVNPIRSGANTAAETSVGAVIGCGGASRLCRPRAWALALAALLSVPAVQALQLTVAWDITSTTQLGFNVERSTDGANFTQIATVASTVNSYTDANLPTGTYWYRVRAFDTSNYSAYSNVATTEAMVIAPSFTAQPASQSVEAGANVTFSVAVTGSPMPALQWRKDGVALAGATAATLTLSNVSTTDAGTYQAVAVNSGGSVISTGAVLTVTTPVLVVQDPVAPAPLPAPAPTPVPVPVPAVRLQNFSARAVPGKQGNQTLDLDFTIAGATKSVLLRGVGPGLGAFTTATTFTDPKLSVTAGGTSIASNDNWDGTAAMTSLFGQVGAFPLQVGSKDAALVVALAANSYSAGITGKAGGVAMVELYDADAAGGCISKLDARAPVGSGEARLIGGFTIAGTSSMHVLIRAIGPGLGGKGVLSDPQLEIYNGATLVVRNDNWGGTAALSQVFATAGASSLSSQSKDAAVELTLAPGTYTATVSGVGGGTGMAQLEMYVLP
jgi:hypothetical protein